MSDPVERLNAALEGRQAQAPSSVTRVDLIRIIEWLVGYLLVGCIPRTYDRRVFETISRPRLARWNRRIDVDDHRGVAIRIKAVFGEDLSEHEIRRIMVAARTIALEEEWGGWRASHHASWDVQTEVEGLEHATTALELGHGVVFWGMSFCGTLFPKIALTHAGIPLTQLSKTDHGASFPLTTFGRRVVAPAYCLPENRYLQNRIYFADDGDTSYLRTIGRLLRSNGCIWIAGDRRNAQNLIRVEMLGKPASFPRGAPVLALRYNASLIPAYTRRLGRFHYRVTLAPPIEFDANLSRTKAIERAVQKYADLLGEQVMGNPSAWDWSSSWVANYVNSYRHV